MTDNFSNDGASEGVNGGGFDAGAFMAAVEQRLKDLGTDADFDDPDDAPLEDDDGTTNGEDACVLHNVGTINLARVLSSNPAATAESVLEPLKDIIVSAAFGRHEKDMRFEMRTSTLYNLVEGCLTKFERGKKDGPCFVFGELSGGQRLAKNVVYKYGLGLDFDTGVTVEAVIEALARHGWFAVIHTTHSHLKIVTDVKEVEFENYARKVRGHKGHFAEIPREWAIDYLRDVKKYEPWVLEGAVVGKFTIKDGGRAVPVTHKPMPKVRAIIPFKERFDFGNRAGTQKDAIAESQNGYDAVAAVFGHASDPKCNDPSRLFFNPRIPRDAVIGDGQHEIVIVDGELLDFEHYCTLGRERAEAGKQRRGDNNRAHSTRGAQQFETEGIVEFTAVATDFRAADAYEELSPDDDVIEHVDNDTGVGVDGICPTAHLHTEQKPGDRRFAVRNAALDGSRSWGMWCLGATCSHESGNDRLWFLDQWMVKNGLTIEDLLPYSDKARVHWEKKKQHDRKETGTRRVRADIVTADQIEERGVTWLWEGHIPKSAATLAAGPTKVGKSQFGIHAAARVTDGKPFDIGDGGIEGRAPVRKPGRVVIITGEDALHEAVVPRLKVAGADLQRVHILKGLVEIDDNGVEREGSFSLARSLEVLSDTLEAFPDIELVVIDPVNTYVGKVDAHKNAEVRAALQPVRELAEKYGVAVLLIHHMKKGAKGGNSVTDMVGGSNAFVEAVRSVIVLVPEPGDTGRSILQVERSNYARSGTAHLCQIEEATTEMGNLTSRFVILEGQTPTITAGEALAAQGDSEDDGTTKLDVVEFLLQVLGEGEVEHKEVQKAAKAEKLSWSRVRRMSTKIGVQSARRGFGTSGAYFWTLPQEPQRGREVASMLGVTYKPDMTAEQAVAVAKGQELFEDL